MSAPGLITSPVTGTTISTTTFGIPVADAINYLTNASGDRPYCHAYLNGVQTLSAGVQTAITLDGEVEDTDSMHTGSDAFLTVNTAGLYLLVGQILWPSTASGTDHTVLIQNSTEIAGDDRAFLATTHRIGTFVVVRCAVSDTLSMKGQATSGGTLGNGPGSTFLQAAWLME